MALLDTAADRREAIIRQIYEVNRETVENGKKGNPSAILVPIENQHDAREAAHLVDRLNLGGVEIYRADAAFYADGAHYAAGTFVIPMTQVFARYAKDMIETQTYPEVRRGPNAPPEPPYDVTAWSLGMLLGVQTTFVKEPLPVGLKMTRIDGLPPTAGDVTGSGTRFAFDYKGPDTALAINRLLKSGAHVEFDGPSHVAVTGASRATLEQLAKAFGLAVKASASAEPKTQNSKLKSQNLEPGTGNLEPGTWNLNAPRVAMYQPWTGGNM